MNRRIAAWTITAVAILGLTACSGSPSASDESSSNSDATSAPVEETSTDQAVGDACDAVEAQVTGATSSLTDLDVTAAMDDPQATVDSFAQAADAIGAAAESTSNPEVKDAMNNFHDDFNALRDLLSAVLIDGDMSVTAELTTVSADIQESAMALSTLCGS